MKATAVSIILPLYNGVDLTRACLDSLTTYVDSTPCELILVDNASTDATSRLLDSLPPSVSVILNATNLGFARACNQGAWAATTPYLLFLNNDTVVTPSWLEPMIGACEADVGIVGCRMLYPNGTIQHAGIELIDGLPDHSYRHQPANLPSANIPRELDMVTGACLLIKRELFLRLGGFDETYRNGVEDIDLCLRVREAGYRVIYQPKSMIYHHEGQSSGRFDHVAQNLHYFNNRWQGRFDENSRFTAGSQPILMTSDKSYINEQRLHVVWQGSQFVYDSLALVNREICQRLIQDGHELSIIPCEPDDFVPDPGTPLAAIQEYVNRPLSQPADVVVRHQWPPDFNPPTTGHWVMIQPWEFGSIPVSWIEPINTSVDEVWAYTSYVRDCYVRSGVNPDKVSIVPLGVNVAIYKPGMNQMPLPTRKKFRFLFVGGTIHRKGIDLLLAAYRRLFTAQDDVCLVIKDMGGNSFYHTAHEMIQRFSADPLAPEIAYINSSLTSDEMAALYRSCHCLVHPYRGEGFGLPIAEAMASGLPVIITGYGAALDFCPPDIGWHVPAHEIQFATRRVDDFETVDLPWLAEPDLDVLCTHMQHAFNNPDEAILRGTAACRHIREHFTWDHTVRSVETRLLALRTKPILRITSETNTPRDNDMTDKPIDNDAKRRDLAVRTIKQAQVLNLQGETDAAVTMLIQQGIGVAPEWPAPYVALAELLMREQRFTDALQVVQEMPSTSEWAVNKEIEAICYAALGNDEAAKQAAGQSQKCPRSLVVFGTLAARQGNIAEAESFFRRAIETDPSCGGAWLSLGMLLWGNGDQDAAYRAFLRAATVDPLNNEAVQILRDLAARNHHNAEVLQIIFDAAQLYPDSRNLSRHHAELLALGNREREALEACEAFLIRFGVDEDMLSLALQMRRNVGVFDRLSDSGTRSISLCMIVKNEEIFLPACLASLKPVVDEMIIVDTGSTDRTVDIATVFGARVLSFSWNGNFSDARNFSLASARGSWILVMDADEVLSFQDYELLRQAVSGNGLHRVCWSVMTRNYTHLHSHGWVANDGAYQAEERSNGWHPSWKVRLFPNDKRIRFAGEVHELVDKSAEKSGYSICKAPFVIHHYGGLTEQPGEISEKKLKYFELGKEKLGERPNDLTAIGELAVQAAEMGLFDEAVELWDRFLLLQPGTPKALFNRGFALMGLKRYSEALEMAFQVLEIDPTHKEAVFNYATCELYVGSLELAITRIEQVLVYHESHPPLLSVLAVLLLSTGRLEQAQEVFTVLKARNYDITEYIRDRATQMIAFDRVEYAESLLNSAARLGYIPAGRFGIIKN